MRIISGGYAREFDNPTHSKQLVTVLNFIVAATGEYFPQKNCIEWKSLCDLFYTFGVINTFVCSW